MTTQRITEKFLQFRVDTINKLTNNPLTPWSKGENTPYKANVGTYYLEGAYGGMRLVQMANDGGGIHAITGYCPKRELLAQLERLIDGIHLGRTT